MRTVCILIGMVLAVAGLQAQDFGSDRSWDRKGETDFIVEVAQASLLEVELGKLAQERASSQEVRAFGAMMERDHLQANEQLKQVAQRMQLSLPASLDPQLRSHIDQLKSKSGEEFDKAYMDMMVNEHRDDIDKFETAKNRASNSELKRWVENTLPVLESHLEEAKRIK